MATPPPISDEAHFAVINMKLDVLIEQRTDHEVRLRSLEKFRWILLGAAIASGPVFNALAPHISA